MWSVVEREMSAMSEILSKMLRIQPQDRIGDRLWGHPGIGKYAAVMLVKS